MRSLFQCVFGWPARKWRITTHRIMVTKKCCGFHTSTCQMSRKLEFDLSEFPVENIRNFSIIAHVDHGKSTLADRLLEFTGVIPKNKKNEQVLDKLQVERERGITVKAQTASLFHTYKGEPYLLNLIDTPGHVDFNYEVSRSLSACQGVVLLIDANQGVQAQTVANFYLAFEANLAIVPVLNKIDLKNAKPEEVIKQVHKVFEIEPQEVLKVSAKLGTGVGELLDAIVERIPPPSFDPGNPFKALMFDSSYDVFRGVVANIAVFDGVVRKGDKIQSVHTKKRYEVREIGVMYPHELETGVLYSGQVGYMSANIRNVKEAQVGDTFIHEGTNVDALPGFRPAIPMVYAGVFPNDQSELLSLKNAIEKLTLNDSSVAVQADNSPSLGNGWRLGFLGLLHMDVFTQRLEQEFDAPVIVTTPSVPYKVKVFGAKNIKAYGGEEVTVYNPCSLPNQSIISEYYEPMVQGTIIAPEEFLASITAICYDRRGLLKDQVYIDDKRIMFTVKMPLSEVIVDFFDELKSVTQGYASFDYEDCGYEPSDLVKLVILLNGKEVEEMTVICHLSRARYIANKMVSKLKEDIPRQLFLISIQAAVGSKILCRENIKPYRKDVTAKCYGGDVSRKIKLLKRQAEGKKRLRLVGKVEVPKEAFINILKR